MKFYGLLSIQEIAELTSKPEEHFQQERQMKEQLEALIAQMHSSGILFEEAEREFRRRYILHVAGLHNGNVVKTAVDLGWHRNTLSKEILRLGLFQNFEELRSVRRKKVHSAKALAYYGRKQA